ncbi:MAG: hypothetical protein VKJ04_07540 [Vampirovibrionales bacterium]|nr:hypothetical protein [Vampirovibrionales bacterium]
MQLVGTQANKMTPLEKPMVQFGFSRWYQAANDNYLTNGAGLPARYQHVDQARTPSETGASSTLKNQFDNASGMISNSAGENLKFQNAKGSAGNRLSYLA